VACRAFIFALPGASVRDSVGTALNACGIEATSVTSEGQVLELTSRYAPECAIIVFSPCVNDEIPRLAEQVRHVDRNCPVVVLTSSVSTEGALRAMRAGISDLFEIGDSPARIASSLQTLLRRYSTSLPVPLTASHLIERSKLVGRGSAMTRVRDQIARVAESNANVLITGETGTGKELAAELIHDNSKVKKGRFVAINCAAVPETLLESELFGYERGAFTGAATAREGKLQHAAGGTLFLDEIGDMSLLAQAKILRAVESRVVQRLGSNVDTPVQLRLLAATNQDLEQLTREKKFRQDLYYRLSVVRLDLPPLRDRVEDIPDLAQHILTELTEKKNETARRLECEVVRRFQMHSWPGNIRELRNVLECILVYSSSRSIGLCDVPEHVRRMLSSSSSAYGDERSKILRALNSAQWNRNKTAEILRCSRMTLYRKMVKFSVPSQPN
jgi:DNA-binding NtrC family response regulator